MNSVFECAVCRIGGQILRCARCQKEYYCSKEHQRLDWKRHKPNCRQKQHGQTNTDTTITYEGSSENEILNTQTQVLSPNLDYRENKTEATMPTNVLGIGDDTDQKNKVSSIQGLIQQPEERNTDHWIEDICQYVIHDLETFGVCVVDNFLGAERGQLVLNEVFGMYKSGVFKDGQLVSSTGISDHKTIRGDQITWIDGNERDCVNIGRLIREVDAVVKKANKMSTGALSRYTINDRTKAMVACYPGSGSHYVKHIDNPNEDGRCVTAIYYLNKDWDAERYGGILRIFPVDSDKVANIEPIFDRLLFFWSDRRNPHEVRPAYKTRYAITLWYFDAHEREKALSKRRQNSSNNKPVKEKEK